MHPAGKREQVPLQPQQKQRHSLIHLSEIHVCRSIGSNLNTLEPVRQSRYGVKVWQSSAAHFDLLHKTLVAIKMAHTAQICSG
jgi:hypothetical protein